MSLPIEKLEGLNRRVVLTIPAQELEDSFKTRLSEISKTSRLPGFRPGKVPPALLEKRFGAGIREEVINKLLNTTIENAFKAKAMDAEGRVSALTDVKPNAEYQPGQSLEVQVTFEVYPTVELIDLTGQTIERPVAEISEADEERVLENLKKTQATWHEVVDSGAKRGDRVTLDFKGTLDGEVFKGGQAQDYVLELGSGQMIPGFEDGMVDMKVDEKKTIPLTFPETYHEKTLAGKNTEFEITLKKIESPRYPEMDDAFASALGEQGVHTVAELHQKIRQTLQRQLKNLVDQQVKHQVIDKLLLVNPVEVPKSAVDKEIEVLQKQRREQFARQMNVKEDSKWFRSIEHLFALREPYEKEAQRRVQIGVLFRAILEKHELKADNASVKTKIQSIAQDYENPDEIEDQYFSDAQAMDSVEQLVLEEKIVAKLMESATIVDKPSSYTELLAHSQQRTGGFDE